MEQLDLNDEKYMEAIHWGYSPFDPELQRIEKEKNEWDAMPQDESEKDLSRKTNQKLDKIICLLSKMWLHGWQHDWKKMVKFVSDNKDFVWTDWFEERMKWEFWDQWDKMMGLLKDPKMKGKMIDDMIDKLSDMIMVLEKSKDK